MSQGYGPYSVTAGTIQPVGVDPNTAAVFIQNDTPFYLFVSFNPTQPSPSTILNQDWAASIKPFDSQTEYITGPAQLQTPQGAMTFQGKVWLLPVDLRNVGLAQNGTVSSAALVSVRSFLPGEQPPVAYSSSRQTDITSQTRVITVPMVPQNFFIDSGGVAQGATLIPFGGTVAAVNPNMVGISVYCYAISAQQFNAANAWTKWEIGWAQCDFSNTIYGKAKFAQFMTSGTTAAPPFSQFELMPTLPIFNGFGALNPNTTVINLYITHISSASGGASDLLLYIQMSADVRQLAGALGPGTPPPIGGGANQIILTNPSNVY